MSVSQAGAHYRPLRIGPARPARVKDTKLCDDGAFASEELAVWWVGQVICRKMAARGGLKTWDLHRPPWR